MKLSSASLFILFTAIVSMHSLAQGKSIDQRVDSVWKLMTLEEKIGQMNQYNGDWAATGPITTDGDKQNQIRNGQLGSMINVVGVQHTRQLQEMAMQSRLKIPLLFGQDVIHGYKTIFPIPLAEAASWDLDAIEKSARIAAIEASASGIHWTFAPMVDIARDPRWGRVMEGAGEDPYLGSLIARARVKGFQGKGLGATDAVMACAKHFAAYGAAVAGRDYNSVDMSERMLWEVYLPPFKAALDAGVATFMNSFNDLNGVPATGNKYLQREILKGKWKFTGIIVSDWGSVGEMVNHGNVKNNYEAAQSAVTAGCDMDMESRSYKDHLAQLVKDKKVPVALLDDAVKRILRKKFEMGLFDDPFRYSDEAREKTEMNNPAHKLHAREMAKKSIVLLKNEGNLALLPLTKSAQVAMGQKRKIALIGPFIKGVRDHLGFWSYEWPDDTSNIVTIWDGIAKKITVDTKLSYARGCGVRDTARDGISEAIDVANAADLVILSVGEARDMTGEAKSRSNLHLPGVQEELVKAIAALGKPIILLVSAGRPIVFDWNIPRVESILYTWWLGTEAGDAIADVMFGDYNPSGRLPITFPRTEGQIPIYYSHYNTGRPARNDSDLNYVSAYTDLPNSPAFPFGFGLSYSKVLYSDIQLSSSSIKAGQPIDAQISIKNAGRYGATETVQLYIRDLVGSIVRPVKELKGFQQVFLKAGESKTLHFKITIDDLKFYNEKMEWAAEPGDFKVFIGGNSRDVKEAGFALSL